MESNAAPKQPTLDLAENTTEMVEQVSEYGYLIMDSLYFIIGGMIVIFLLYKLASKLIYPYLKSKRLILVIFGTLYVLVLVITALMALKHIGYDVQPIGQLAILIVLIGAVVVFFLAPFLPRFPFMLGHMVEINGVLGTVDAISTFHTTIRKFDGSMVFIPNALVMATRIINFHDTPTRRIEMKLSVNTDSDLQETKDLLLRLMSEDERVLTEPSPPAVFIAEAQASGTDMVAYCWVNNADWLSAKSDLWLKFVNAFMQNDSVALSLPQQEVYVMQEKNTPDRKN